MRKFKIKIVFFVFLIMTVLSNSLFAGKINNIELSEIKLLEVYPSKLFLRTDEVPEGRVKIKNTSKKNQMFDVKVWLTNDLGTPVGERNKQVSIKPSVTKRIDFKWDL